TYLFIGGVPLVLVVAMAAIAGYFLVGQFATFLTLSEIHTKLQELADANSAAARRITPAGELPRVVQEVGPDERKFPGRIFYVIPTTKSPSWLKDGFHKLVIAHGRLYLRAANETRHPNWQLLITSVPVDQVFLSEIASKIGP